LSKCALRAHSGVRFRGMILVVCGVWCVCVRLLSHVSAHWCVHVYVCLRNCAFAHLSAYAQAAAFVRIVSACAQICALCGVARGAGRVAVACAMQRGATLLCQQRDASISSSCAWAFSKTSAHCAQRWLPKLHEGHAQARQEVRGSFPYQRHMFPAPHQAAVDTIQRSLGHLVRMAFSPRMPHTANSALRIM
jgi:hypothetical protein